MKHLRLPLAALIMLFSASLIFAQTAKVAETEENTPSRVEKKEAVTEKAALDASATEKKAKKPGRAKAMKSKPTATTDKEATLKKDDKGEKPKKGFFRRLFSKSKEDE